jgi:hypothetical protein
MILILTQPFDPHAENMAQMLQARGAEFVQGFATSGGCGVRLGTAAHEAARYEPGEAGALRD